MSIVAAGCVARPAWQGPLPVRNQHPAQLTVMHMAPAPAAVLTDGATAVRLDAAYSSLFLEGQGESGEFFMDGEYLRVAAGLRVGLGAGIEVGTELPFAHTSGGFLDSFIIDYHDAFGLPDQDRRAFPKDEFEIAATSGPDDLWRVDRDSLELLDVPVQLSVQVVDPAAGGFGLQLRCGIELPTGDDERGYGNGEIDASVGTVLEYRLASVALYGHVQHTFAGTPDQSARAGLEFADVTSAGLGTELPLASDLHALVQVEWETSTLRELGFPAVARDQFLLWVGGRWQPSRHVGIEVGLGEDLQTLVSPDFTAWFGMVWKP